MNLMNEMTRNVTINQYPRNKSGEQDDRSTGHDMEILNDSSDDHETPKAAVNKKVCTLD